MTPFFLTLIQGAVILLLAPFATGLVRWCKARLQGRKGASPFLPYVTYATLLKKEMVISSTTSWVFAVAPYVVLTSSTVVALILPLVASGGALGAYGNFMLVAGLFSLGSVFLVLGGLDPGSAFGGMGASREMTLAALVESSVITMFAAFAVASGSGNVSGMLAVAGGRGILAHPGLLLSLAAFVLVLLAENARYPVDNPATHLELTMVHEAMVLEYSGPYLAMLEYASSLKLTVFSVLLANLVFPMALATVGGGATAVVIAIAATVVKLCVAMGLLALLETSMAKMRFYRMQEYMTVAFIIAFGGLVLVLA
jgi:formate hydrogenlyase subunit 4